MKKIATYACLLGLTLAVSLTGCGGKTETANEETTYVYNDGTYEGESPVDVRGSHGIVTITIKDDKIMDAKYKEYLQNGKVKDEEYGKVIDEKTGELDQASYKKAQGAVAGQRQYGSKLVEAQDIDKVDVISGSSGSYENFKIAVKAALEKAKK